MQKQYQHLLKIVFVGQAYAGKTSLLRRITESTFHNQFLATIGVDFKTKIYKVNDKNVKVQFWDTAGQQRFRSIQAPYYRGANAIIICYSLNDKNSILNLNSLLKEVGDYTNNSVPCILVGCKRDLDIEVPTDAILGFLENKAMLHFQTSAKTGEGIEEAIQTILEECLSRKVPQKQNNKEKDELNNKMNFRSKSQLLKKKCC